jgi:hypothetical protein
MNQHRNTLLLLSGSNLTGFYDLCLLDYLDFGKKKEQPKVSRVEWDISYYASFI